MVNAPARYLRRREKQKQDKEEKKILATVLREEYGIDEVTNHEGHRKSLDRSEFSRGLSLLQL